MLKRGGRRGNHKRVERIYREGGLGLRVKCRKKRAAPSRGAGFNGRLREEYLDDNRFPTLQGIDEVVIRMYNYTKV